MGKAADKRLRSKPEAAQSTNEVRDAANTLKAGSTEKAPGLPS